METFFGMVSPPDPEDLPRMEIHQVFTGEGTKMVPLVFWRPSTNEVRRRWRKNFLEPRLLAALRARLAQLEGAGR